MTKEIWLNLPVKDVNKTAAFFEALGFKVNGYAPNSETMVSMAFGSKNFIINFFREDVLEKFSKQPTTDTSKSSEVVISIDAESVADVDELLQKAINAGGKIYAEAGYTDGWMYGAGFSDLDGHRWNYLYMDMSKMPKK
jgi:predicted lactoylglutathione lyase